MELCHLPLQAEHKYNFGEDESGLFEFDEELALEEGEGRPVPAGGIALNHVKARVDRVHVDGLNRTKDDVIEGTVDELFKAKDFEDVIVRSHKVRQALDSLGCFDDICVMIDVSSGPDATPDGLEVTFQVRELSRVMGGLNTSVAENEGSLVLGLKLPNLFGRGERAAAAYSVGYRNTASFHVTATKPLPLKPLFPVLSGSVYHQNQDYPWSGYHLLDRGMLFDVGFKTSPTTKHNVQWEGLVREMSVLNKTSFKIRESSGPQLKSILRHTISMDHRDEPMFPTRGVWLQVSNELAGLGGSVANLKTELHVQANHTLSHDAGLVLQLTGALGVLHDVYGTQLPDHFFLGGPTTLRGFQQRGVGPHSDGQALGGKVYWASGLHVYAPLPGARSGLGALFRSHVFLNAGCLALPGGRSPAPPSPSTSALAQLCAARVSCGAGLCVRLGRAACFELNYVIPLRALPRDVHLSGVQFGVGAHFL